MTLFHGQKQILKNKEKKIYKIDYIGVWLFQLKIFMKNNYRKKIQQTFLKAKKNEKKLLNKKH